MSFRRSILPLVSEIARLTAHEDREEGITTADVASETTVAPAKGGWQSLPGANLVGNTLELVAPDGTPYQPYRDYFEDAQAGRWQNLRIPEGESVTAEYYAEESELTGLVRAERWRPLSPLNGWLDALSGQGSIAIYREGSRSYLRGRITSGTVAVGTSLFSVEPDDAPLVKALLTTMSDAGPVMLEISAIGQVRIADSPFEAGNTWLALDGLSWRYEVVSPFEEWSQEDTSFERLVLSSYGIYFYSWGEDGITLQEITPSFGELPDFSLFGEVEVRFEAWGQENTSFALLDVPYSSAYGVLFEAWGETGITIGEVTATYERLD